jgi:hypothetical protein
VACADANTFYIAAMMTDTSVSPNLSFIGVMKSVNGGASWSAPVAATAAFDVTTSHWDKPWIAVDPANPNFVYVGATFVNTTLCGPGDTFTGIGAARSINSGATFLPHVVIDSACDTGNGDRVGGSQIAVGPTGDVLVSWLEFEDSLPGAHAQLLLRRSVNNGAVYAAAETVSDVFPAGGAFFHPILDTIGLLRGGAFQPSFPTMAVDRSGGAGNGAVYVAWNDGRLVSTGSGSTAYRFGDIFLARREPGGGWGPPVRVNNSAEPQTTGAYAGQGFDQFRPAVAVDRTGTVAVCYYDRRGDKSNFLMTRWCAKSTNGGATWQNKAKSTGGLPLLSGVDDTFGDVTDQGIYDSLVSDTRNLLTGFRGAWTDHTLGNQDLKQNIP